MLKFLESNENKIKTYQNIWDIAQVVLRRKFTTMSTYIKKYTKQQQQKLKPHNN